MTAPVEPSDEEFSRLLRAALDAVEEDQRWEVVQQLHRFSRKRDFDAAEALCHGHLGAERRLGADILGQLGGLDRPFRSDSIPVLLELLHDPEPSVVHAAAVALSHLDATDAGPMLLDLMRHQSPEVRQAVAVALPRTLLNDDVAGAARGLIALSCDEEAWVRDWATFGLGTYEFPGQEQAVHEALLERLSDEDDETRLEALGGLGKFGDQQALQRLMEDLEHDDVTVVHLEAAAHFADPRLCMPLRRLQRRLPEDPMLELAISKCCP